MSRDYFKGMFFQIISQIIRNSISIDELPSILKHTASGMYLNLHISKKVS